MSSFALSSTELSAAEPSSAEHRQALSHILRRLHFGVRPGEVEALEHLSLEAAVQHILETDEPLHFTDDEFNALANEIEDGGWDALTKWYLGLIASPAAGFHERMVWFWHTHLTSSTEEADDTALLTQNRLFRTHALGNFRELMKAVTVDAAMLRWLDGDSSSGDAPNENYAREMMELFTLGPGSYTEYDVRVAARALSGWRVQWDTMEVSFEAENHYARPMRFMGERRIWDVDSIIDKVCDQPACARHIARALHLFLVGTEPDGPTTDELAEEFRSANMELQVLIQAIVALPEFTAGKAGRPRDAVEWMTATMATLGPNTVPLERWWMEQLGQVPFNPPNVAGWPTDDRWVGASQQLSRMSLVLEPELSAEIIATVEPTVDAVLAWCGLYAVSDTTRDALQRAIDAQTEFDYGLELLFALALTSPEFAYL